MSQRASWFVLLAIACTHDDAVGGAPVASPTAPVSPLAPEPLVPITSLVPGGTVEVRPRSGADRAEVDAVLHLDGQDLVGAAAFQAALARVPDPLGRSRAAIRFIERRNLEPFLPGSPRGAYPAREVAWVADPRVEGRKLVYWRPHDQTAGLVRVTVDLDGFGVQTATGASIADANEDPVDRATQELASEDAFVQISGLARLAASGDPRAPALVLYQALNARDPRTRAAAVERVTLAAPQASAQLQRILAGDTGAAVRAAAAKRLGQLGAKDALPVVKGAASGDADPVVRARAAEAAKQLGG